MRQLRLLWLPVLAVAGVFGLCLGLRAEQGHALKPTPSGKETGLIPREILFGNPDKAGAKLSHDGKYLSYLAPVKGVLNVWVGPADDPAKAKPVTNDKKRGIRAYSWAFTNQHLLYTQDADGDEDFHVYCVNLETGKTEDLTPLKKIRAQIDAVSHKFPDEVMVNLNDRDPAYHDLYRLNITTGAKKLVEKNTQKFAGYLIDDNFKVRFAMRMDDKTGNVLILKPAGKEWKDFLTIPSDDSLTTNIVGFDASGDTAYMIDSREGDTGVLKGLNVKTGKSKIIAENAQADVGGVMLHPTKKTVQAVSFTYLRTTWDVLDPAIKKDFDYLKTVADGDFSVASRTLDDKQWIVAYVMDNGPVRYYRYDRTAEKDKAKFLFTNRTDLEGLPLQKMHGVVIGTGDKLNLVSYLTLPPGSDTKDTGRPKQPVPLVLNVHGGPWGRDSWGYNPTHQFLANRGYAVLSVNFRGSTGFGKKFINAGNKEWAGKMHQDLLDAVDWAIDQKIAVPSKVGIMGGSYGGYATLVGLTFTPDKFACGVDIVGPSNLVTLLKTIPPYWAPMMQMFKDRVGDVSSAEGQKFLLSKSPLKLVEKIKKPLLIGQGANDPRVKQAESDQIVQAMKEKKIPVTYVLFPDEGHGFARPENRLAFMAVTEAFLAEHLGGRYEAIGTALKGSTITVPAGAEAIPGLATKLPKTKAEK